MAAKSKRVENKLLKLEKLQLRDLVCSICHSILIEPVTLPCYHYFCQRCFNGSIENNALCCPLCRLRIGSWLRTATKQKNLVNDQLWDYIKTKFSREIENRLKGNDINLPEEVPILRLSAPGEIRSEYEAEIKRLKAERLSLEQKHFHETETLIKKIQQEEQEAQKLYLERLKQDEKLANEIQHGRRKMSVGRTTKKRISKPTPSKPKLKSTTIDSYLSKIPAVKDSPLLTDDNTSTDSSAVTTIKTNVKTSPEMVPSYTKLLKNFIDNKIKTGTSLWNKENGDNEKKPDTQPAQKESEKTIIAKEKPKNGIKSLLVSLPLPCSGIPQQKPNLFEHRSLRNGSVDSMHQELCYFKPIERTTPMSLTAAKGLPLRVPCRRVGPEPRPQPHGDAPSRAQYIEGLCRLRNMSPTNNLPSAFVLALKILRAQKESTTKCTTNTKRRKRPAPNVETVPIKRNKQSTQVNGITKLTDSTSSKRETSLRRTRSMGSLKDENESTPKKSKIVGRKATSEGKPYLRSDSKKVNAKKRLNTTPLVSEKTNNDKIKLAVKNLSSPLKNCDVKKILQEQLRIEKIIEQEQSDYELACKIDSEWNGRRQLRRTAVKRQVTINYGLRTAKKLKV